MNRKHNRRSGLSLIEMLVSMTVVAGVLIVSLTVYNLWWKSYSQVSEKAVIERQLTSAMEIIVKELGLAQDVTLDSTRTAAFYLDQKIIKFKIGENVNNLTDPVVDSLIFSYEDIEENLLDITITNTGKSIELVSRVKLLNKELTSSASQTSIVSFNRSEKLF